jgi:hypothetical protein
MATESRHIQLDGAHTRQTLFDPWPLLCPPGSVRYLSRIRRTCGCPGGGPGEVPSTCRCHLPRIVDSPIFVPDRDVPGARWDLAGLAGLRGHAVRLMKRRGRHGLGGSCDGQNKSNSVQPDHCHLHMNLPMTHPIARTKPMGPGLAFVHKRSAH